MNWSLVFVLFLCFATQISGQAHAPDAAPEINREAGWCLNGSITRTTGECICSSHLGFYCKEDGVSQQRADGKGCQSGYGISFHHYSCTNCACVHEKIPEGEWKERKNALKQVIRKQQQQGKL